MVSRFKGPFPAAIAVSEFKKQFKAKSGTNWENRHGMVAKKGEAPTSHILNSLDNLYVVGKYTWLGMDNLAGEGT